MSTTAQPASPPALFNIPSGPAQWYGSYEFRKGLFGFTIILLLLCIIMIGLAAREDELLNEDEIIRVKLENQVEGEMQLREKMNEIRQEVQKRMPREVNLVYDRATADKNKHKGFMITAIITALLAFIFSIIGFNSYRSDKHNLNQLKGVLDTIIQ